jgi:CheY-like chemotaxis protein
MAAPRVLVADDDAWILRMVTTVLEKRGYDIQTACDGEDGFHKAIAYQPDLIILDVMMPKMDGWALLKKLRSRAEFAFVPVIFLTALGSDEDRIRGFRLGADDYLPKPFRFEELDLRVANALKRRTIMETETRAQARAVTANEGPGLRGTLDQIGLPSLLTLLEMERKSGVLVVSLTKQGNTETGRIFLRAGRVVRARFDGKPSPKNEALVFHVLGWAEGSFEFSVLDVDMDDEIGATTTHLLMEGARLMDERKALRL